MLRDVRTTVLCVSDPVSCKLFMQHARTLDAPLTDSLNLIRALQVVKNAFHSAWPARQIWNADTFTNGTTDGMNL